MATNATASTPFAPPARRRAGPSPRPIAAALDLGPAHDGLIELSQQRCTALGLSRIERPDYAPLGRPDLVVVRERNRRLHSHAAPVMEMLAEQIVGTESMVVLCDSAGTIIHSIGDDDFLSRASQVALQPGVNWSEQAKGTNAIGTALMVEAPTLVHADEHYMHANHFLTCSASPILDPRGNILGVLDVTGDHRSYHQHTMALVKMSARMIENHWLSDHHRNALRLHFHNRPEFIDTLMEGILVVSPEGRIVGANRGALEQLGLGDAALRMHTLASLFGTPMGTLMDRFRSPLAAPMPVQTAMGRNFHVHARVNWSAWGHVAVKPIEPAAMAEAAAAPAWQPAPTQPKHTTQPTRPIVPPQPYPALAALLTGDPQVAAVVSRLQRVLNRGVPITLIGDTGTGKLRLAQALHQDSSRAQQPFVALHCAGLPAQPTEAQLFSAQGLLGRLLQASGGTLFLGEVGQLPAPLQARLLHALHEGQLMPPGHSHAVPLQLALVCTSSLPLRDSGLRPELQHRLSGLTVTLPPLRERTDLPALAQRLLDDGAAGPPPQLSPEALAMLQAHRWPGNLRELHNVLRTAALLAGPETPITPEHLPDDLQVPGAAASSAAGRTSDPTNGTKTGTNPGTASPVPVQSLQALELQALRAALDAAGGNITLAAKRLGVGRNTIYRKLRWAPSAGPR